MYKFSFLAAESAILLYASALGIELGIFYDCMRVIRRVWSCKGFVVAIMDLTFWGFTAKRTFYIMHTYSNGTLRWFAVLGVLVVLFIYMKWISCYIVKVGVFVFSAMKTVVCRGKKILTKNLKLSIIKLGKSLRKGRTHGKKSSVSDKVL